VSGHVHVCQGYRFCLFLQFFNYISGTVPTVMYFFLFHFIPMKTTFCRQYYKDDYPPVSLLSMVECSVTCVIVCRVPFVDLELLKLLKC
jgi:hypothetical protein